MRVPVWGRYCSRLCLMTSSNTGCRMQNTWTISLLSKLFPGTRHPSYHPLSRRFNHLLQAVTCVSIQLNAGFWRLTFYTIIVLGVLQLPRAAPFWNKLRHSNFLASLFLTTWCRGSLRRYSEKANRRLYAIRQLKRSGVPAQDIVKVYCSIVRSTLEYASVVYANLPRYLSDSLEMIQKRAMAITYPGTDYNEALVNSNIVTL